MRFWILKMVLFSINLVSGLDNGLALTPPMGFANWNGFGCNYNDSTIRGIADALVDSGMRDAGYNIIIIQECITPNGHRDEHGVPQPDPKKFPHGMKNLVDYIHSKDLLAGIYTDVGPQTCAGYEGSYEHDDIDAQTYAAWGIDFVEQDACHKPANHTYQELYGRMRDALNRTGRPIIFYSCVWGSEEVYKWGQYTANLWRTTGDICSPGKATWRGMLNNFRGNSKYPPVSGPGHWQDPDMLVVGMNGLTPSEWKAHFSLWAISAAPLWAGIDLRKMNNATREVFLNKEVIAVDQDPLGIAAHQVDRKTANNEQVDVQLCKKKADVWEYNKTDLSFRSNNFCLSIESCSTKAGGSTIMWKCVGSSGGCPKNQMFDIINGTHGKLISSRISNMCLTATTLQENALIMQQPCDKNSKLQQWIQSTDGSLKLVDTDLCMDVGGSTGTGEVWAKRLSAPSAHSAIAVLFFNPDDSQSTNVMLNLEDIGLDSDHPETVTLRDLWTHTNLPSLETFSYSTTLGPHGIQLLKITQS